MNTFFIRSPTDSLTSSNVISRPVANRPLYSPFSPSYYIPHPFESLHNVLYEVPVEEYECSSVFSTNSSVKHPLRGIIQRWIENDPLKRARFDWEGSTYVLEASNNTLRNSSKEYKRIDIKQVSLGAVKPVGKEMIQYETQSLVYSFYILKYPHQPQFFDGDIFIL